MRLHSSLALARTEIQNVRRIQILQEDVGTKRVSRVTRWPERPTVHRAHSLRLYFSGCVSGQCAKSESLERSEDHSRD